jgi:Tol biopolymer transport system component
VLVCALAAAPASSALAAFPGANGKIAFSTDRDQPGLSEIYVMSPDGANQTRLTNDPAFDGYASWSGDGRQIAFERGGEIWVMNADGSDQRRLTNSALFESHPTWSPSGDKIAFERRIGVDFDIWVMNPDGSGEQDITPDPSSADSTPAWSPDGAQIAFVTNRHGTDASPNYEVYVMDDDGTDQTRLTDDPAFDGEPDWSPDGFKIAFTTNRNPATAFDSEIYSMNRDGSGQTNLTGFPLGDVEAAWAPDGTRVAFTRQDTASYEIYTMDPDGHGQTALTANDAFDSQPDWQPLPNRPPDCSGVAAHPDLLEPANRRFRRTALKGATDPDGDRVALSVDGVTQDEPVRAQSDRTAPDAMRDRRVGVVHLRAERRPKGDGRVYRIEFTASDRVGGSCSGTAKVSVPRHKHRPAVDSAPPSYDSFGS